MNDRDAGFSAQDQHWMERALRLAECGTYTTQPNPRVGCVIVRDGRIVGEGFHRYAGEPHAEVFALRDAGAHACGATVYVTLEPCAHHGRTPPCADALIDAGVARVVAAMRDPFPCVDGSGFDRLRAAGIEVSSGLMESQARELNCGFLSRIERGRPWIRVKLAASLDGRIAMPDGESKWITGEAARADVQRWRARSSAILTGAGTVLSDDPALTVRIDTDIAFIAPLRVVLDSRLRSLARTRVRTGDAATVYVHARTTSPPVDVSAEFVAVASQAGRLDLNEIFGLLAERGINEVQVEAGATLSGALLKSGWVDELLLYLAPVVLGERALPLFSGMEIEHMAQRLSMRIVDTIQIGEDLRLRLHTYGAQPADR
ncbi:MAG: bifunctional diaminohydroxyphosphoribosylaminopyrimidine deaminase/5-amino-6-(5-phosphoribosylamino)uracil reductase RibD [Xanthomonadaceae bacterium]|jgi:diaminohydroxyphosphoribosylaminopyrimidine deaminase/5-amino-6-(5-phosphoribosylamino)uracil reductase|nr:bifunctional diaminohydroxyphosphoribosylaminopyrimidine deaminase/5-amino-6-(5-phosphoribosylamino)uracil reductase RibD [Xanthomonadaceae bacterium]